MSEIKALENLRQCADYITEQADGRDYSRTRNIVNRFADKIQAEVDERFMELPVDADGVPIRVGDMIEYEGDEDTYTLHTRGIYVYDDGSVGVMNERLGIWLPENCRHVKPRTLEDIVIEYRLKAYNLYADSEMSGEERVEEFKTLDANVAAEIRELLGSGE